MTNPMCPVCDTEMRKSDLPKHNVYVCPECDELAQVQNDGTLVLLGVMLDRNAMGDDRVKAAISKPHITNIRSFMDAFTNLHHRHMMEFAETLGAAMVVLAQARNRQEFAINKLSGLDLAFDGVGEVLEAMRSVHEVLSSVPQGLQEKSGGAVS